VGRNVGRFHEVAKMKHYHAKLEFFPERDSFWWNMPKEDMESHLLVPFINGQVVVSYDKGKRVLLNMKTVSRLHIYATDYKLESGGPDPPPELLNPSIADKDCTSSFINEVRRMQADPVVSSLLQKAFAAPEQKVFVIMKFDDPLLDSAYEGAMKPIIEEFGLRSFRISEVQNSGKITDQVLENIATSRFVLADLSGERPNCYYEAGFAHAIGKELIFTIHKGDHIHFNLAGHRFIQWETEEVLRKALRARLRASLEKAADLERQTETAPNPEPQADG
jgi:hypothetical protein